MTADKSPLIFESHLGMLKPANRVAEEAMRELRGRTTVSCQREVSPVEGSRIDGCANTTPSLTINRERTATMAVSQLPSPSELRQLLRYEEHTGLLYWRRRSESMFVGRSKPPSQLCAGWNTRYAGELALNHKNNRGYLSGHLGGAAMLSHRAIWAMVHGEWPEFIDHINGDRADNRLSNLRAVTRTQNSRNRRLNKNNTTGHTGVKKMPNGRWSARIRVDGKNKWLGTFDSRDEAIASRTDAERECGFHPNHGSYRYG